MACPAVPHASSGRAIFLGRLCSVSLHSLWGGRSPARLILASWERLEKSASGLEFPSVLSHDTLSSNDTQLNSQNVWCE